MKKIIDIFPKDNLFKIRIKRLKKANKIFIEKKNNDIIGIVYINHYFVFLANITWITKKGYRNKGIATKLIKKAQQEYVILTAKTHNLISTHLAHKMGFRPIYKNYMIWIKKF